VGWLWEYFGRQKGHSFWNRVIIYLIRSKGIDCPARSNCCLIRSMRCTVGENWRWRRSSAKLKITLRRFLPIGTFVEALVCKYVTYSSNLLVRTSREFTFRSPIERARIYAVIIKMLQITNLKKAIPRKFQIYSLFITLPMTIELKI
jgi:hypothetical protein